MTLATWAGGCDDSGAYQLIVVSGDAAGRDAVLMGAIDEVEIVVTPNLIDGQRFASQPTEVLEGGDVEVRVSATGEWVLRLFPPYLEANAELDGERFVLSVPLTSMAARGGVVDPPTVRATFIRGSERIAQSASAPLPWPLDASTSAPVFVLCRAFFATECQSPR